jgi:inosose dehydratase
MEPAMYDKLISRRRFLGTTALSTGALTAGVALVGRVRPASAAPADRFGGFSVGMQTYTLRGYPWEKALGIIKDLGLVNVEAFEAHYSVKSSPEQIKANTAKLQSMGLKLLGHGVNRFTKDHEANRKIFEFARAAGVRNISADPTEDAFDSLDKLVAEFEVRIAIHNHGPGARYDKIADTLKAIKGHHTSIGACADLGHYIRSAEDPVRAIHLFQGRLYGVHLKDFAEQKAKAEGVILGRGHLDVEGTFRALRKIEFPADGSLSLEYEEKPQDPLEDVRKCLAAAAEGAMKAKG